MVKLKIKKKTSSSSLNLAANEIHFICGGNTAGTYDIKMRQAIQK